jgi:hypothetical protein
MVFGFLENLSALGLLFDGIGVFILGIPMFFNAKRGIYEESSTYYSFNEAQVQSLSRSRIDISVGSVVLIFGFVLQFLAALKVILPIWVIVPGWIIALIFPVIFYCWLRQRMVMYLVNTVQAMHTQSDANQ